MLCRQSGMTCDHLHRIDELLDEALADAADPDVRYTLRTAQQHLVASRQDTSDS